MLATCTLTQQWNKLTQLFFLQGTLHQAVHNLYSMHTALMEHAQQMSTEANAMREQHAKILEQKEDSHNAELAKLEHQRSLLANQLEAAKYFKQQTPRVRCVGCTSSYVTRYFSLACILMLGMLLVAIQQGCYFTKDLIETL